MKHASRINTNLTSLLTDLPPESVQLVEEFVRFLHEQSRLGQRIGVISTKEKPPYSYPTIAIPASSIDEMIGIMPPVGGDALKDSEALYNEN